MATIIYPIHRAINKPLSFKGLKAQWLIMAGAAFVGDLLLFIILHLIGVNSWIDVVIAFGLGVAALSTLVRLSKKYGEYGLMKKNARKRIPRIVRCRTRSCFIQLKQTPCPPNSPK